MNNSRIHDRFARKHGALIAAWAVLTVSACGDDDGPDPDVRYDGGLNEPGDAAATAPVGDLVDEAVLAKCPAASNLIQTSEWMSCIAGKRLLGTEPFNDLPCELRVGEDGAFTYLRDGEVALEVPERSAWRSPTGLYQNEASVGPRIFLASVSPDLVPVEGEARVTDVDISIFGIAGQTDTVVVKYFDAALARQTYNCTLDEP